MWSRSEEYRAIANIAPSDIGAGTYTYSLYPPLKIVGIGEFGWKYHPEDAGR
jgi:hypothetical protein